MGTLAEAPADLGDLTFDRDQPFPRRSRKLRTALRLLQTPGGNAFGLARSAVLKELRLPASTRIAPGFDCRLGNLFVGEAVGLGDTVFFDFAPVLIGDHSRLGFRNIVVTSTHDFSEFETVHARPVVIGSNVWVTVGVIILPGVTIGDGSVIGAGSVVVDDIPPGVLAAGNPCRPVRPIER